MPTLYVNRDSKLKSLSSRNASNPILGKSIENVVVTSMVCSMEEDIIQVWGALSKNVSRLSGFGQGLDCAMISESAFRGNEAFLQLHFYQEASSTRHKSDWYIWRGLILRRKDSASSYICPIQ